MSFNDLERGLGGGAPRNPRRGGAASESAPRGPSSSSAAGALDHGLRPGELRDGGASLGRNSAAAVSAAQRSRLLGGGAGGAATSSSSSSSSSPSALALAGGRGRGPLPLHHSPPSSAAGGGGSSSSHNRHNGGNDDDDDDDDYATNYLPRPQHYSPTDAYTRAHAPLPTTTSSSSSSSSAEFKRLADRIGIQIFKLNANVAAIEKLLSLPSATRAPPRSSATRTNATAKPKDWTKQLADLSDATRALTKSLTSDLKSLSTQHPPASLTPTERLTQQKLSRDFEAALQRFVGAQRASAERSRDALEDSRERREELVREQSADGDVNVAEPAKRKPSDVAVDEEAARLVDVQEDDAGRQGQAQQQQQQLQRPEAVSQADIEFQESLIAERETEIRSIEAGIQELNEIFRDLGHIVRDQGGMIDNIEYNIGEIATNARGADTELVRASDYQRKAGRRCAYLTLIVGGVVAVVLLALLS